MSSSSLINILRDIGLSENQSRVYLASLTLGPAAPVKIASAAQIKRTTVYPVIESLQQLGLINTQMRGFKRLFFAESPDKLESLVEMRHERLRQSLGQLSALHSLKAGESAIKHYEGFESLKNVFSSLLEDVRPGDDYLIFASFQELFDRDPKFFEEFIAARAKLNINVRSLLLDTPIAREYKKNPHKYNLQAKIFPPGMSFTASLIIIPKKVVFIQSGEPLWAMVVENQNIVKIHTELFESFWNTIE